MIEYIPLKKYDKEGWKRLKHKKPKYNLGLIKENERLQHELEIAKLRKKNRDLQKEINDLNNS